MAQTPTPAGLADASSVGLIARSPADQVTTPGDKRRIDVKSRDRIVCVDDSLFKELVKDHLGSVVFVGDYLQLDFGDARFTAYVWPIVSTGDRSLRFGDPGYRDALCAFITHEVTATEESPERGLVIRFALGEIVTNPEPTELSGPEIAQLNVYDPMEQTSRWMAWRPGEDTFGGL